MRKHLNPRSKTFGRDMDQVFDKVIERINAHEGDLEGLRVLLAASSVPTVFNSSSTALLPWLIYGVAGGTITPAQSGQDPVEPLFQALATIAPGTAGPVRMIGPSRFVLESVSLPVTAGAWAWLSDALPGKVTLTMPLVGRRYRVGQFASPLVDLQGTAACYLTLFSQGATSL